MTARVLACLLLAAPCAAQPLLTNAQIERRPFAGSLAATVRESGAKTREPVWIAYTAPLEDSDRTLCCWTNGETGDADGCCAGCRLEDGEASTITGATRPEAIRLESRTFSVFLRVERNRVTRVRSFSDACRIDAGGRTVLWFTGVPEGESVTFLGGLAESADAPSRVSHGALAALGQHAGDPGVSQLIRLARAAPAVKVRSNALFWLAQRAGRRAAEAISGAIAHDPELAVKKRAVFALSQLPRDDGIPLLIGVARSHGHPEVRKQAMFWLGQSGDPRALAFFEEILR